MKVGIHLTILYICHQVVDTPTMFFSISIPLKGKYKYLSNLHKNCIVDNIHQARSQVWIWGVLFQQKWTFLHTFWEKVGYFARILGKSGLFCVLLLRRWTFYRVHCMSGACSLGKLLKNMIEKFALRDIVI